MCRSPLAELLARGWLARGWLARGEMAAIDVSSAGTHAVVGAPMYHETAAVLRSLGGDPAGFVARQLTRQIADEAELILTAARSHREIVAELCPGAAVRTFTLREFAGLAAAVPAGDIIRIDDAAARARALTAAATPLRDQLAAWPPDKLDVPDPVGQPMAVQEATALVIAGAIAVPLGLIAGAPGAFAAAAG